MASQTKIAGTGTSVSFIDNPWTNPMGITNTNTEDVASNYILPYVYPARLKASNFDFDIPNGSVINGVVIAVVRRSDPPQVPTPKDDEVYLFNGSGRISEIKSGLYWPGSSFISQVYGDETDLWETVITPAIINDPNFGVSLRCIYYEEEDEEYFTDIYVSTIYMTIYYDPPAIIEPSACEATSDMLIPKVGVGISLFVPVSEAECYFETPTIDEGEVLGMTVQELITRLDLEFPNGRTATEKVSWINELERNIYSKKVNVLKTVTKAIVGDQKNYAVLPGFYVEDIKQVEVNGIEYRFASLVSHETETYYNENDELCLDPTPSEDAVDALYIVYKYKPNLKLVANVLTDVLALPYHFVDMYLCFLKAKICTVTKNYAEYSNWQVMYNSAETDFLKWYMENFPQDQQYRNSKRWRWS